MELGAGSGALACQIMSHLNQLGELPHEYWILEVSAELKSRQQARVAKLPEPVRQKIRWLERWPSADQRTRMVFITQGIARERLKEIIELLDRMSERTFVAREKGRLARLAAEQQKEVPQ